MSEHTRTAVVEDLERIFDTIEPSVVVKRTLNYLSTRLDCRNVLWVHEKEFTAINSTFNVYAPTNTLDRDVLLSAQTEITDQMAIHYIREFNPQQNFYNSPELKPLQLRAADGSFNYLMPVRDPKTHHLLATVIFLGVETGARQNFEERVLAIHSVMNRHLAFSVEYFRVKGQSFVDDVTSLYNQRYLPLVLEKEISRARRHKQEFSVLFLDVDYFKMVNDTRGHVVGSKMLIEIAELLQAQVRTNDYAFRYGGDEFVILLIDTGTKGAQVVAERIRKKVEEKIFKIDGPEIKVTVSIGIAGFPHHAKTSEQVIKMADQAMYDAKSKSRNLVYVTAS